MSHQAEWQYLMRTVPGGGEYMVPVEKALADKFLPKMLVMESISGRLREILAILAKRLGLNIPNPTEAVEKIHHTSLACIKRLVDSLLTGEALYDIK